MGNELEKKVQENENLVKENISLGCELRDLKDNLSIAIRMLAHTFSSKEIAQQTGAPLEMVKNVLGE